MLLLFKINFEIPGDGEFQSGQIEFYCFNQRHQGEMWAAEVYGLNIISSHFRELNSPCLRFVLCWVKFYSLWDMWASSFFSIISWIQFKTPLPTVQLQLPLSQPSLHSHVLFIPGTQGYQGFLSPELNSNLEIFRWLSFWKSFENQEYVTISHWGHVVVSIIDRLHCFSPDTPKYQNCCYDANKGQSNNLEIDK